jgi:hypothetical protein
MIPLWAVGNVAVVLDGVRAGDNTLAGGQCRRGRYGYIQGYFCAGK